MNQISIHDNVETTPSTFCLTRNDSFRIKGLAVLVMLPYHLLGELFYIRGHRFFNGAACVAMFALVSGYGHAFSAARDQSHAPFRSGLKRFLGFYRYYLVSFVIFAGPFLWMGKTASDLLWTLIPVWPNRVVGSWWYASCYLALCLVALPTLCWLRRHFSARAYTWIVFAWLVLCLVFPSSFVLSRMPPLIQRFFSNIWSRPPILRIVMFLPYYLVGDLLFRTSTGTCKDGKTALASAFVVLLCFPFGLYSTPAMSALDVGASFFAAMAGTWILCRIHCLARLLEYSGHLSVWVWLLHQPLQKTIQKAAELNVTPYLGPKIAIAALVIVLTFLGAAALDKLARMTFLHQQSTRANKK